jgi:hypothetical protein
MVVKISSWGLQSEDGGINILQDVGILPQCYTQKTSTWKKYPSLLLKLSHTWPPHYDTLTFFVNLLVFISINAAATARM